MYTQSFAVLAFLGLSLAGSAPAGSGKEVTRKSESTFACNLDAFTPAERKRHFDELSPMLRARKTAIRELPDGYEFKFPSDKETFDLVAEWAQQEARCCPFFRIEVVLREEGGPLWLRLAGRKGTKEFIRDDFAPWFNK